MEDPNSLEAIQKRATQDDPIVMYLIVRESLNMSIGKTAAQCAHAAQILTLKYFNMKNLSIIDRIDINSPSKTIEFSKTLSIMEEWLGSSFRKVVLRSNDKNWLKIKSEFENQNMALVIDNGLTEVLPGSETCIGLWPMKKSQAPKLIKRLQVLK